MTRTKPSPSQPSFNRRFFKKHFPTPGLVRRGIWLATMLGDSPVDEEIRKPAGLPLSCTMFAYADTMIRYAKEMGWEAELAQLLEKDVQNALEFPSLIDGVETYKFLESRLPGIDGMISFAAWIDGIDWTQPSDGTREDLLKLLEEANA